MDRPDSIALIVLRLAARIVPVTRRTRWLDEWTAELWHEREYLQSLSDRRMIGLYLFRAALGSFNDARAVRRIERIASGRAVPTIHPTDRIMNWVREATHALRGLRRNLGFTLVAITTLGLGIGAVTAIFSVVNAVLIQPLPYPGSDRLVVLGHEAPGLGSTGRWGISVANHFYYRENVAAFEELGTYRPYSASLTGTGHAELVHGVGVSKSLLDMLGARTVIGRTFTLEDDVPDAPWTTILGHELWVQKFGSDPNVIGSTVEVSGYDRTIIGVMAPGFHLPTWKVDLWTPLQLPPTATPRNEHTWLAMARLKDGVTVNDARRELQQHVGRFAELFPTAYSENFLESARFAAVVEPLHDDTVGDVSGVLWILLGSVSLVLLIACANVANLFLVRAEGRRREIALREAIGGSRTAIAKFFLTESVALALAGGLIGVALASAGISSLLSIAPESLPRLEEVTIDGPTFLFAAAVSVTTGLIFGCLPLIHFGRLDLMSALQEGGRSIGGGSRNAARKTLVVVQVAMALMVLVGAGLMMRSFQTLRSTDPGFAPQGVVAFNVSLPVARYPYHDDNYAFYRELLERLEAIPGVEQLGGVVNGLPLEGRFGCYGLSVENRPDESGERPCVPVRFTAPGYFETMGIPIVAGRGFERRDNDIPTGAVVVSETLARQLWPNEDPLGKGVKISGPQAPWYRVVGVAGDVREYGLEEPPPETAYFALQPLEGPKWAPLRSITLVLRTGTMDPTTVIPTARSIVAELDSNVPVSHVRTLSQVFNKAMAQTTLAVLLIGIAAAVALLIGTVGIYGLISYVVSQRTTEVGIRMAMGAQVRAVSGMVLRQSLKLVAVGVVVGLAGSLALQRVLGSILYGVSPTDLLTLSGATALLLGVAVAASYLPARRAAKVDPMVALRSE